MRWLWGALAASALSLSGCGGSGAGTSEFQGDSGPPGVSYTDATVGNLFTDASNPDEGGITCTKRTCAQAGANCGPVADGCGSTIDCGDCAAGESCGGGGTPSVCGGAVTCVPKTCADPTVSSLCGQQPDGCGGLISTACVTCTGTETCGGGSPGTPSVCGGTQGCVPATAATACVVPGTTTKMNCGVMGDGCGGVVQCSAITDGGAQCPTGEECGAGGTPNVCGASNAVPLPDGGVTFKDAGTTTCVPFTTTAACQGSSGGTLCGPVSNGCGGQITCPSCTGTNTCGGGGTASVCGHPACKQTPQNVACASPDGAAYCGLVSDGCGGTWSCATCTGADTCGGGGVSSMCGHPSCTPLTKCPNDPANGLPYNCGPWPDGCGSTIDCGSCTSPNICGGGGQPSQCGDSPADGGGSTCDAGLKCDIPTCTSGTNTTTLTGTILSPSTSNPLPLYDVVVYVPNTYPQASLSHGVPSCATCASLYTGDPVSATTTATDGTFTLTDVPVPANGTVPVVIQVGKWRRQMMWPGVKSCQTNTATTTVANLLRLPGSESAAGAVLSTTTTIDELPQIAVSTGGADSMECLFRRIGFADAEYVSGSSTSGHIHIFQGSSAGGTIPNAAVGPGNTTPASMSSLWDSTTDLDNYDIVILSCEGEETRGNGSQNSLSTTDRANLVSYTTNGGRVFASHFHYSWMNTGTFGGDNLATWVPAKDAPASGAGVSDYSDPIFDDSNTNQLNAEVVTTLADGGTFVRGAAMASWLGNAKVGALGTGGVTGELYISNPRYNASVSSANTPSQAWLVPDNAGYTYTDHDNNNPTLPSGTTQYMSFDTPVGGTNDAGAPYCGRVVYSDLHVGAASSDYPNANVGTTPTTPSQCAPASNALSPQEKALLFMLLDLASCVSSDTNLPTPPAPVCTPLSACPANYTCGEYPNGCDTDGGFLNCGTCATGATCVNGQCEACTPLTTCPANVTCGDIPNGCGGILSCGTCASTMACIDGTCSTGCTPLTACPAGVTCGVAPNGCGGTIPCGTCTAPQTCGGGGTPGVCGLGDADTCSGFTCSSLNLHCGPAGNGCGGLLDCGDCTVAGQTCGGGGVQGVCGAPSCTPKTCAQLNATCGQVADGCGGVTAVCGTCSGNDTCGGGGTANQCGAPACTPETCAQAGANCGPVADGCGGVLQCGTCTAPDTCGGGGVTSVCGNNGPK